MQGEIESPLLQAAQPLRLYSKHVLLSTGCARCVLRTNNEEGPPRAQQGAERRIAVQIKILRAQTGNCEADGDGDWWRVMASRQFFPACTPESWQAHTLEESEEDGSSEHRGEDQFISPNAKQVFFWLSFSRHPREAHPTPQGMAQTHLSGVFQAPGCAMA